MSTHSARKHARLSASGRPRWAKCPASIRLSDTLPEPPSSEAAEEGTRRHEWGEWCLRNGITDAREMVGFVLFDTDGQVDVVERVALPAGVNDFNEMTDERAAAVNVYLAKVWELLTPVEHTELYVEVKLDEQLKALHPGLGGTADACIWNSTTATLDIIDAKYGWWEVSPKSPQLWQYLIGAWLKFRHLRPRRLRMHIVQPKASTPVKTIEVDVSELIAEKAKLQREAAATDDPNAPFVPGEHCKFCPGAVFMACKARADQVTAEATRGLGVVQRVEKAPGTLNPDELRTLIDGIPFVRQYLEHIEALAKPLVREGKIPGKKLVVFQQRVAWNASGETVADALAQAFPQVNPWKKPDLRTPKEIETAVGAAKFKEFKNQFTTKTPYGEQIVDLSDERPALLPGLGGLVPITTG